MQNSQHQPELLLTEDIVNAVRSDVIPGLTRLVEEAICGTRGLLYESGETSPLKFCKSEHKVFFGQH